jgi:hypothetical protein
VVVGGLVVVVVRGTVVVVVGGGFVVVVVGGAVVVVGGGFVVVVGGGTVVVEGGNVVEVVVDDEDEVVVDAGLTVVGGVLPLLVGVCGGFVPDPPPDVRATTKRAMAAAATTAMSTAFKGNGRLDSGAAVAGMTDVRSPPASAGPAGSVGCWMPVGLKTSSVAPR